MDIITITSAIINSNVAYGAASVTVAGKTATDKRLSVVEQATFAAKAYLSGAAGSVGKASRAGMANDGLRMIAAAACKANYKPLADAIAATLGESVIISKRATFEALPDVFRARIVDLKDGGYKIDKKGLSVRTAKRKALDTCLDLCLDVSDVVDAYYADLAAKKAQGQLGE